MNAWLKARGMNAEMENPNWVEIRAVVNEGRKKDPNLNIDATGTWYSVNGCIEVEVDPLFIGHLLANFSGLNFPDGDEGILADWLEEKGLSEIAQGIRQL